MMLLLLLLLDDYGWPCYYAGRHPESSTRRTEYVVVMVVRVRARRRWSRLLDWMWIGRRDDTDDPLRRCVSMEDRMKNDGSPA